MKNEYQESEGHDGGISVRDCCRFIRECGHFFLATSVDDQPRLRPFGMLHEDRQALYFATDKRKSVYADLQRNSNVEIASFSSDTRKWIRVRGKAEAESSPRVREEMMEMYSNLRRAYTGEDEMYFAVYRLRIDDVSIT